MKVKRLIYASSCSVYGDHGKKLVNEKDELRPLTVYVTHPTTHKFLQRNRQCD
jgi:nucleoside-diphosphate-sugar epimerase